MKSPKKVRKIGENREQTESVRFYLRNNSSFRGIVVYHYMSPGPAWPVDPPITSSLYAVPAFTFTHIWVDFLGITRIYQELLGITGNYWVIVGTSDWSSFNPGAVTPCVLVTVDPWPASWPGALGVDRLSEACLGAMRIRRDAA